MLDDRTNNDYVQERDIEEARLEGMELGTFASELLVYSRMQASAFMCSYRHNVNAQGLSCASS